MTNDRTQISFPGTSVAQANILADSLVRDLKDIEQNISVDIVKENSATQDFGATVVLILGTAAATKVAAGIGSWIARHGTRVSFKNGATEIVVENAESPSIAKIAAALAAGN